MEDLIKRSDAIKGKMAGTANANAEFLTGMDERERRIFSIGYADGWNEHIDKCKYDIPSAEKQDEWIPCSERLPKRQGHYICTCKDGSKYKRTTFVKWSNGWQLTGTRSYWIVLAWMPLPEPWKGA